MMRKKNKKEFGDWQTPFHSDDVDRVLSSGARDEVFLAARLGISAYLSRGARGAIPIILDEPLSAVDDEKFLSGMRFFMENLSQKHQVLIMSCHAERHRWLQEQVPELFAERVEVITLNGFTQVSKSIEIQ